ncbi:MarR family winged helix-turn-helix transcriptional regulator [Chachezhania sediminis]|uniref:MarR family winged helix-turn-helix transcriptional regulator n=1 Tax=Chachezhania sediminis TaxID=2599291 RepID=UPI001E42A1F6|nr:MarR family winged helix-turn-helix transcriptional regulator [Chachezhania sediminis]
MPKRCPDPGRDDLPPASRLDDGSLPDTPPEDRLPLLELVAFAQMQLTDAAHGEMTAIGLDRAHHRALYCIRWYPGITVRELGMLLRISTQALARMIRPLVNSGLVEQRLDGRDRRLRRHYLTETGARHLSNWSRSQHAWIDAALAGCPRADLDAFWRVMEHHVDPQHLRRTDGKT